MKILIYEKTGEPTRIFTEQGNELYWAASNHDCFVFIDELPNREPGGTRNPALKQELIELTSRE